MSNHLVHASPEMYCFVNFSECKITSKGRDNRLGCWVVIFLHDIIASAECIFLMTHPSASCISCQSTVKTEVPKNKAFSMTGYIYH